MRLSVPDTSGRISEPKNKTAAMNLTARAKVDKQIVQATRSNQYNLIWERTQAGVALLVTGASIVSNIMGIPGDVLNNAFFLVIGFYFGRTNHTRPSK